jgi:RimJ/RimL family protein N-acetyltransferase/nitrite reductase/ring-hydroxylating ferredoxin subunit
MPDRLLPPNPPLSDGVIALRPFKAEDAPAITAACQDPEIQHWVPIIPVPYTETDARGFILLTLQAWHDGTGYEFAIADPATDQYLGSCGLHRDHGGSRHAVGYLVAPEARRRGYATRALRLLTRWAFDQLDIRRLALWTLPGNVASQSVAQKAGFRFEGLARNWETDRDERSIDAVMFSMTPEDLADAIDAESGSGEAPIARVPRELWAAGARSAPFLEIAAVAELAPGTMRRVTRADVDLLVAWTDDGIVVTDDRCPHMSAPLSVGALGGCVVACPLHEGRFDLGTGETVQMPTTGGLDADGVYHAAWSPSGAGPKPDAGPEPKSEPKPEPTSKKLEARRLTRVNRLRYYPARIRDGKLEAQVPIIPE